jgi:hypothetical protein
MRKVRKANVMEVADPGASTAMFVEEDFDNIDDPTRIEDHADFGAFATMVVEEETDNIAGPTSIEDHDPSTKELEHTNNVASSILLPEENECKSRMCVQSFFFLKAKVILRLPIYFELCSFLGCIHICFFHFFT